MVKIKFYSALFLLGAAGVMVASEQELAEQNFRFKDFNIYEGQELTPKTIGAHTSLPEGEQQKIWQTLGKENIELIREIATMPAISSDPERIYELKDLLKKAKLLAAEEPGHPSVNWHIKVPSEPPYSMKIAGRPNHRETVNVVLNGEIENTANHRVYGTKVTPEEYEYFRKKDGTFYQTISRAAYYLILERYKAQWQEKNAGVEFPLTWPKTYLLQIPDQKPEVNDDNYVVIEPWYDNLAAVKPEDFKKYEHNLLALSQAPEGAVLWDVKQSNIKLTHDGKLMVLDLEQSNTSNPKDFCGKNILKMESDRKAGAEQLANLNKWAIAEQNK